ncbi:MAG: SDR family NAD(P)-dependent oxidoreductase [Pirellulales bacterium]|nr:SDR family NAD(P)-dependent oxidoreductase [Pirellulales bacterium]
MEPQPPAVLITGTSTGIGAACALALDRQGFLVLAGVRKEEDAQRLRARASLRLQTLMLDVTDEAGIRAAAQTVGDRVGEAGLAGLVNNAGILVPGPLELVAIDQLRRQLEVNVIGQVAMVQAFLPLLRRRRGRIVGIGSIAGRLAPPYLGAYAASKAAVESMTDCLRVELRTWGIHVALVEPDSVDTPIWEKLQAEADRLDANVSPEVRALYDRDILEMRKAGMRMDRAGMPVDRVVRAVHHALTAKHPKTRYPIGWRTRLGFRLLPGLPDRLRDWIMLRFMGVRA